MYKKNSGITITIKMFKFLPIFSILYATLLVNVKDIGHQPRS